MNFFRRWQANKIKSRIALRLYSQILSLKPNKSYIDADKMQIKEKGIFIPHLTEKDMKALISVAQKMSTLHWEKF